MEPATGESAESCRNVLMFSSGEILPCAEQSSLHTERASSKKIKMMICENRGIARKTRDLVAESSLPCAITSATDPGKIRTV